MPQPANPTSQSYYLDSTMDYFRDYLETIDSTGCSNMVPGMIMGMDTNKLTSLRPLYMGIIEYVAPKRST